MPSIFDWLSVQLLAFMNLLGVIRARRHENLMDAFANILDTTAVELYREVELFVTDRWTLEFAALDVQNLGLQYFVGEAAAQRPTAILLEAACRLKGVQLVVWDIDEHRAELYGQAGPLHTVIIEDRFFVSLLGEPLRAWHQTVAHEVAPGTSSSGAGRRRSQDLVPVATGTEQVMLVPVENVRGGDGTEVVGGEPNRQQATRTAEAHTVHEEEMGAEENQAVGSHEEQVAVGESTAVNVNDEPATEDQPEHEELPGSANDSRIRGDDEEGEELPAPAAVPTPARAPGREPNEQQMAFSPADITALPPHMAAELVAPAMAPYTVQGGKFKCRLPNCGARDKEFATIGAWRKHVALARSHLRHPFCALCGHFLIVPQDIDEDNIKAHITAHKRERCVAASKTMLKQRRAEAIRLEGLLRDVSHILLPEDRVVQDLGSGTQQQPTIRRKRAYGTEEARRADICARFLKRFKADQPQLMAQIASEHQLDLP